MTEKIDISIIIPCFNSEKRLPIMLNSLLKENLESVEIIIVNDGSTDMTADIVEKYILQNPALKIKFLNQENKGVSAARNNGIKNASGKYLICFDSDDYIEDGAIKIFKEKISSNENLYAFNFSMFYENKNTFSKQIHQKSKKYTSRKFLEIFLKRKIRAGVYSLLVKRDFLEKTYLSYKESLKFGEDYLFIFELFKNSDFVFYDDRLIYHYTVNSSSVSNSSKFNPERLKALEYCKKLLCSTDFEKLKIKNAVNFFLADMYCANLQIYAKSNEENKEAESFFLKYRPLLHHFIFCPFKYWLRIRFFTLLPFNFCKKIINGAIK